jgi:hypothetical protein
MALTRIFLVLHRPTGLQFHKNGAFPPRKHAPPHSHNPEAPILHVRRPRGAQIQSHNINAFLFLHALYGNFRQYLCAVV